MKSPKTGRKKPSVPVDQLLHSPGSIPPDEWRLYQKEIADYLLAYAKGEAENLDIDIAYLVGNALRELASGYLSPLFLPHREKSGQPLAYAAKNLIAHAVLYVKLARQKVVQDNTHTRRIADYFGVTQKTVREWVQTISTEPAEDFWKNVDFNSHKNRDEYHRLLKLAGENYQLQQGTRGRGTERMRKIKQAPPAH